jgi:ethylbenzene dioxygenase beta subunit
MQNPTPPDSRNDQPRALYNEILDWVYREAELLDDLREREWLETMVAPDIVYQMPIRQTVKRASGRGFLVNAYHLDESYGSLLSRIQRTETEFAWSEDPPSPSRHFVSNLRLCGIREADIEIKSNLLLFRSRGDHPEPTLLAAERQDRLTRIGGTLRLRRRVVLLDLTVLETHNLSVIF